MKDYETLPPPPVDRRLLNIIYQAFAVQYGREPGDLHSDLVGMADLFNPTTPGRVIRGRIGDIRPLGLAVGIHEPWLFSLPNGAVLVTPEGRAALDVGESGVWPPEVLDELASFYRVQALQKIRKITTLLRGEGPVAHPASIAAVLFLLLNRSTTEGRAIPRDGDVSLTRALQAVQEAFIKAFAPSSKVSRRELVFRGGYGLTEAGRRLGSGVLAEGETIFIHPDGEEQAKQFVLAEIRRRGLAHGTILRAFDMMVEEYELQRPALAAAGCAFARASATAGLRHRLVQG